MSDTAMRRVSLADTVLEVEVGGSGEPVLLIQTALNADEFMPVASQPGLRDEYQLILYHRRGVAVRRSPRSSRSRPT